MADRILEPNDVEIEMTANHMDYSPMTIWTPDHRTLVRYYFDEWGDLIISGKQGDLRFLCFMCQIFGNVRDCPIKRQNINC